MASDQSTYGRWNIGASHKTSTVVAMHRNLGWFVPVDLLLNLLCGFDWRVSLVVSIWLCAAQHSWIHVTLHEHNAMIMPVLDGTGVGDDSFPSMAMWRAFLIRSMRNLWCFFVLYERFRASCRCSCCWHGFLQVCETHCNVYISASQH